MYKHTGNQTFPDYHAYVWRAGNLNNQSEFSRQEKLTVLTSMQVNREGTEIRQLLLLEMVLAFTKRELQFQISYQTV